MEIKEQVTMKSTKQSNQEYYKDFFNNSLLNSDIEVSNAVNKELHRQQFNIELIASENIVSQAVLDALGSTLTNKYAEGYPHKRYYGGCEFVDEVEILAIERAKKLFNCTYANVQPNSGSQANQAVYNALLQPNDTILGMSLAAGGHLTHGAAPNQSGKWFKAVQYGVRKEDSLIDYDEVERLALEHKPKLIIAGFSAYPRKIDFAKFREIADKVGAYLLVDMAHVAGLVAVGAYPSPLPHAHVVTSTTHKTLRASRGGLILSNDEELGKKFNSSIFPGIQGGPLMNNIAGKAVAFGEALKPEFKEYINQVVKNAKILSETLLARGVDIVTGGTDNHIVLVDLRPKKITGKATEEALERAGLTCNKNSVPFDPEKPFITSGVRLGTPAGTTRGFKEEEFKLIANLIGDVIDGLANDPENNEKIEKQVLAQVHELCKSYPIYNK